MMKESVACYKSIIFMATCTILAHCAIEPAMGGGANSRDETEQLDKSSYDSLTLHKRPSFFVGSRYGRSGAGTALSSSKIRRLNVVPRNDRFFLGSRYGKRAEGNSAAELFLPYEQQNQQTIDDNTVNNGDGLAMQHANGESLIEKQQQQQSQLQSPSMMSCVFTGYRNYYRCRNIDEINNIINQLTVAHSVEEK
ncbi:uncharacterized protein RYa [Eurosta solidaginis]|uniref:uncharacterized protein RYa n=1 Tax=Eurosta solidaginis TaxID=178769 RepID=UPI003530EBFB